MSSPRSKSEQQTSAPAEGQDDDNGRAFAVRRAPFSDNPKVGARGQRTQQRILDAALEVFGDEGYYQCSIDRITTLANCSRGSFYQYFSGKEDVFRYLAGQVARQLGAAAEALEPITPDARGRSALRTWVGRHADIYARYEPVFRAFQAAAKNDEEVADGSQRTTARDVARICSRVESTTLSPRQLEAVIRVLVQTVTATHVIADRLRTAEGGEHPEDRVEDALADMMHRTLFGRLDDINVLPPPDHRPPPLRFGDVMVHVLQTDDAAPGLTETGRRTLAALMVAGRKIFAERGFHATRIDDIVSEAGVSHGAFYRYFQNKEELARVLTVRSMQNVAEAFTEIPGGTFDASANGASLRRWLRRYNSTHASEMAMIRAWADAGLDDNLLDANAAASYDWGRRRMAEFLQARGFGDADTDGIIMVALLESFGAQARPAGIVDAAAQIIERGFLGR